jgi:hypothetical protein
MNFSCPHCDTLLEIDQEYIGQTLVCPNCNKQFAVDAPKGPTGESPTPPPLPARLTSHQTVGNITTVSGDRLTFDAILLFDSRLILTAEQWKAAAAKNFRGVSTGLFFIGGLAGVVAKSLALGAAETAVSKSMSSQGQKQIQTYYECLLHVRNSGIFVPLDRVENIRVPIPSLWRSATYDDRGQLLAAFCFNDDPFVALRLTNQTVTTVFWNAVEQYRVEDA